MTYTTDEDVQESSSDDDYGKSFSTHSSRNKRSSTRQNNTKSNNSKLKQGKTKRILVITL